MATCELCGSEVTPGDMVVEGTGREAHFFCGHPHRREWLTEQAKPKPTMKIREVAVVEPEAPPEKTAQVVAEKPKSDATVPPVRRRRRKKTT